jgi:murein DD-endopeptidase MepM/ murein hydrolase activator NlpD
MNALIPALLTALTTVPVLAGAPAPDPTAAGPLTGPREVAASGPVRRTSAAVRDPRGSGVWPVGSNPEVVHGFAPPTSTWGAGHRGVDLAASVGDPVRSALSGQVVFTGRIAGRGVVVVDHGATRTTYEPVTALARVGDLVTAGMPVGVLQAGGHCLPASCLHWGWIDNADDSYLDPLELVGAVAPVRLWPWAGRPAA